MPFVTVEGVRTVLALRVVLPSVWIGLILGLSFIETPLKFLAPGITVPLGLGIGRLVFWALAIAGWMLLLAVTGLAFARPRPTRAVSVVLGLVWAVLLVQTAVIRPALSARSDIVIAGGDPGPSILHYVYIAADLALLALLVTFVALAWRAVFAALPQSAQPAR